MKSAGILWTGIEKVAVYGIYMESYNMVIGKMWSPALIVLGIWAPQRLAHWYHFTCKPRRMR